MIRSKRMAVLGGVVGLAGLAGLAGVPGAQATVVPGSVTIDAAPAVVARGETFDVTFSWDHELGHCNTYGATLTVGDLLDPVAQTVNDYDAATLDCPGPNTRTESLTIPGDAPTGPSTLTVNVAEFTAGGGFDDTADQPILIVGACPSGGSWVMEPALGADDPYDKNADGLICTKLVEGKGNSANSQRGGGTADDVGHIDGHNHKDNNG